MKVTSKMARNFIAAMNSIATSEAKMSNRNRKPRHSAKVFIHPTATHNPDVVKRVEKASGRRAVLIDGQPVLVAPKDAAKYLTTGT